MSEGSGFDVKEAGGGVTFSVKVVPGSSKTTISGILGGMLKVKVASPPEKGKANKCLVEFLADQLGIKKKAISIVSGQTSAVKQIQIGGVSIDNFKQLLDLK